MLIIIDKKIPLQAKLKLKTLGKVIELETIGITYEAISGHPDIFFFQSNDNTLLVAPNLPDHYYNILFNNNNTFIKGKKNVGNKYPSTSHYNAIISDKYLIHNTKYTDSVILDHSKDKTHINIKQAYTRCNLISLGDSFITSDEGIFKTLNSLNLNVLFVSPVDIELPSFIHGFFGGTCGIYNHTIYIIGSLKYHCQGEQIKNFINEAGYTIVELYDGKLFDGGSILFID